jgi:hypothetical protein
VADLEDSLDENIVFVAKYFITSNAALNELQNPFLRLILAKANIRLPQYDSFRNNILPKLMKKMKRLIQDKLQLADAVSIVCDSWSSKQQKKFIAVTVNLAYPSFEKESLVLNITITEGTQNAERIKECIEEMINGFEFNKTKIYGNFISVFQK